VVDKALIRRQLGRALRKARTDAGMTQVAIATKLGCTQGKINKIETTLVAVSPAELEIMLQEYQVSPAEAGKLRELLGDDNRHRSRGVPLGPSAFEELSERELDAVKILSWHSERIPGPLHSEQYMLRQFTVGLGIRDVTELIRRRQARAHIFTVDNPPSYQVILSESSLQRMPGGRSPSLVIDQAEHLQTLIKSYDRLTLRILTYDAKVPYVDTDFVLLRFERAEDDFAFIEYPAGSRKFTKPKELKLFEEHWQMLREAALSPDESLQFLDTLAAEQRARLQETDVE
jgi:transcriptional regulator with XRE-family HTH domain